MTSPASVDARVLVIGLDGASFDILDPLLEDGLLPNLAALCQRGKRAVLETVYPPISAAAWPSFYTGTGPGKHGVFAFERFDPATYGETLINASTVAMPAVWDVLTAAGMDSVYFNMPVTYPPRPLQGALVTGMLTPSEASKWAYPPVVKDELATIVGNVRIRPSLRSLFRSTPNGALQKLNRCAQAHQRAALHLLTTRPWRLAVVVFDTSDSAQHAFIGPATRDEPPPWRLQGEAGRILTQHYQRLDSLVGGLLAEAGEDCTVLVMSDHGACARRRTFVTNEWLAQAGYLRWQWLPRAKDAPYLWRKRLLGKQLAALRLGWLAQFFSQKRLNREIATPRWGRMLRSPRAPNWLATRAFADPAFGSHAIRINLRGRERDGIVEPGAEYEGLRDEIAMKLRELVDPVDGRRVIENVWRREELYNGPELHRTPDLLFSFVADRYVPLNHQIGRGIFGDAGRTRSGQHSSRGILIGAGPGIQPTELVGQAHITALAPTILRILGIATPHYMDGEPLEGYCDTSPQVTAACQDVEVSARQAPEAAQADEQILKRLEDLGYL